MYYLEVLGCLNLLPALDGGNLRTGLSIDLGFSPADRAENVRRAAKVAKSMTDAGLIVIVALESPFESDRRAANQIFAEGEFIEVFEHPT